LSTICFVIVSGGKDVKVGEFSGVTDTLDFSCGGAIKWAGNKPPKDRTLEILEHSQVNLSVYITLAAAACLGILLTIAFLSVNIMYRNQRYVIIASLCGSVGSDFVRHADGHEFEARLK